MVTTLIDEGGARVNLLNSWGFTALDLAQARYNAPHPMDPAAASRHGPACALCGSGSSDASGAKLRKCAPMLAVGCIRLHTNGV